ncbi:EAL domain-containing protein [Novosphingobium sp. P6W]|uniref:EAL domain-containing protein n=1 Tax=Novosphingobium sp. P6W TaxID=1609758 RepID=UPI0005C53E80|nr:EAL domain-containing protein [Novosphingobium sp. P6W]AXB80611.1 cyclic diguanylate phosphodiesterase [Novosphingobium sp. P6W]
MGQKSKWYYVLKDGWLILRKVNLSDWLIIALSALLPGAIACATYYWLHEHAQQRHIDSLAVRALDRAEFHFKTMDSALHIVAEQNYAPCSEGGILQLRSIVVGNRSVDEIQVYDADRLKCSSWDRPPVNPTAGDVIVGPPIDNFLTNVRSAIPGSVDMVGLRSGRYAVLTRPDRLLDEIGDPRLRVTILHGETILAATRLDGDLPGTRNRASGVDTEGMQSLLAVAKGRALTVRITGDRSAVQVDTTREMIIVVLLGLAGSSLGGLLARRLIARDSSFHGALEAGIRNGEMEVEYQPIINLKTGRCAGAEALVRWRQSDGTFVPPDAFLPLAEQHGLLDDLTDLVIEKVVFDLQEMLKNRRDIYVAINISSSDMESGRFLDVIGTAIAGTEVAVSNIWIEATERSFIDAKKAKRTTERARAAGHRVAIDDFGTGYSSLSLLQHLPLTTLKIDRSFVEGIGADSATRSVIPFIVDMAQSIGLDLVAEGVEAVEQAEYLLSIGVTHAQGWLYSKSLPIENFISYMKYH